MSGFRIDPSSAVPVFEQLVRQARLEIARGRLRPGDRLPPVRELALELLINPNTVQKAYTELQREGVIHARKGLGVFVSEIRPQLSEGERDRRLAEAAERWIADAVHLGLAPDEIRRLLETCLRAFERDGERDGARRGGDRGRDRRRKEAPRD